MPWIFKMFLYRTHSKDWKIFNNQKVFQFIFHHHHLSHFPINNQLANFSPFSIKDLVKSIFLLLILRVCELREDPFLFVAECPNWDLVFFCWLWTIYCCWWLVLSISTEKEPWILFLLSPFQSLLEVNVEKRTFKDFIT